MLGLELGKIQHLDYLGVYCDVKEPSRKIAQLLYSLVAHRVDTVDLPKFTADHSSGTGNEAVTNKSCHPNHMSCALQCIKMLLMGYYGSSLIPASTLDTS